ncbi:YkgJ family cysteine cluster protein [uncultured Cyclobacterium sp.]|uniref:YkgJ family cysteine cluster protein n=1 Tax=uncultured Cyclobacterium sp. TaxID=453820 RepID=UPI0030EDC301|tara:strand:+ start:273756 stop:274358 length:603 start_codon:yes stop_codon:yes gene_type:complete
MSIARKVELVERLFYQLEQESAQFEKTSGLGCVSGCGKCCSYPDIEASPLEFLPWAFHLFLNGEAESTLNMLEEAHNTACFIYKPLTINGQGRCSDYKYRGLICRLFGFAANKDKYGNLRLATCKIIKEGQTNQYNATVEAISKGLEVPIFTDYYMQLNQIDFQMGNKILPVNKALKMALEEVLQYYAYRPCPEIKKKAV